MPSSSQWINGDRPLKVSEQANGTAQLRLARRPFQALPRGARRASRSGDPRSRSRGRSTQAPASAVGAFLQGLFDADGCVVHQPARRAATSGWARRRSSCSAASRSCLATFGVFCRHLQDALGGGFQLQVHGQGRFEHGPTPQRTMYDLRITSGSIASVRPARRLLPQPASRHLLTRACRRPPEVSTTSADTARLVERTDDGIELTYNLSEPRNHSYVVDGFVVRNCSEYMHLDNSACNLASLNLLKFLDDDDTFDVEALQGGGRGRVHRPGDPRRERRLPHREDRRDLRVSSASSASATRTSARCSWPGPSVRLGRGPGVGGGDHRAHDRARLRDVGPHGGPHGPLRRVPRQRRARWSSVLRMHQAEAGKIDEELVPFELLSAAQESWDDAVELAERSGVRNSQAAVLAPTGTIGLADGLRHDRRRARSRAR